MAAQCAMASGEEVDKRKALDQRLKGWLGSLPQEYEEACKVYYAAKKEMDTLVLKVGNAEEAEKQAIWKAMDALKHEIEDLAQKASAAAEAYTKREGEFWEEVVSSNGET